MNKQKRLKVAFIIETFPKISGTFILKQFISLVNEGHHVEIFPSYTVMENLRLPGVLKLELLDRVFSPPSFPTNKLLMRLKCLWLILINFDQIENIKRIFSLNFAIAWKTELFFRMIPFFGRDRFDIIHCHFGASGKVAVYAKTLGLLNGKTVMTFYGYDSIRYRLEKEYYRHIIPHFDSFIVISDYLKNRIDLLGSHNEKINIIPLVLDFDVFTPRTNKRDKSKVKLLSVSRLDGESGIYYAITAFSKIHEKYQNLEYNILGDGALYEKFNELIKNLGLENKVFLRRITEKNEIKDYYIQSDIFISPSILINDGNTEEQDLALHEAQAMELAIISTSHKSMSVEVIDGKTGFLVPERDVQAMAAKFDILIANSELRETIGRNGRNIGLERFNYEALRKKLLKVYIDLLK